VRAHTSKLSWTNAEPGYNPAMTDVSRLARILDVEEVRVRAELAGAIRRSEPDAREVYGVIDGRRFVARRARDGAPWRLSLEHRPQPWERESAREPGTAP
jgi:hypothetical protein